MPYLIGEMSDGIVVAVEVNTAVFKSFNKMAKNAGRMGKSMTLLEKYLLQ